jgi:deferrochelatase/peroxidase EfeB
VSDSEPRPRWTRRRFLTAAGAGGAVAAVGAATAVGVSSRDSSASSDRSVVDFHGARQAGIVTPAQDRLHFAAFDLTTTKRADLIALLRAWTDAARRMTLGQPVGTSGATAGSYLAPPDDTGEALELAASRLTITIGFGPTLFTDAADHDRFGLAARRPAVLRELPHFAGDKLDPARSGGDLCVQACADDPQVAVHAVRNLARIAFGSAALRWSQLGFGRTSSTSTAQATPRNLMGFKDGTANRKAEDNDLLDQFVWVGASDDAAAGWLAGGTYLVARRIKMQIHTWDRTSLGEQEAIFGRDKRHGAPLSGGGEFTTPDFEATGNSGPLIATDAHVRLAHPIHNGGSHILRRGYNFTDGSDGLGHLDAGLFFVAFTRDAFQHFVPLQTGLARADPLNEYIQHTGSALFAVPPGVTGPDRYVGQSLFDGV